MTGSFRMQATRASFFGVPASTSLRELEAKRFDVMDGVTAVTRAPVSLRAPTVAPLTPGG